MTMPELSVSTWSLHRELGPTYPGLDVVEGAREPAFPYGEGRLSLLDVPAAVAELGIHNLEVCHFHFPSTDTDYLRELRGRLDAARVSFTTLLVDEGDLTAEDEVARRRDLGRIGAWVEVAAAAGARRVRVIAGYGDPGDDAAVERSVAGLATVADRAQAHGVGVITENWLQLAMRPETLVEILDRLGGRVGLCVDFGNYSGAGKYEDLDRLLPYAATTHAKADFPEAGRMDEEDFTRCLDLTQATGFDGEYVLIFDGPGDERTSLARILEAVWPYL
jgi:sugar phosphate isomerase/epimerase